MHVSYKSFRGDKSDGFGISILVICIIGKFSININIVRALHFSSSHLLARSVGQILGRLSTDYHVSEQAAATKTKTKTTSLRWQQQLQPTIKYHITSSTIP